MVEYSASFASVKAGRITALPRAFTGEGLGMSRRSSMYMLRALSSASTACTRASSASSPKVLASGTSGKSTRMVPLVSRFRMTGYRNMMSPLFQTEILLDFVFQPIADFLLSVHRQDGRLLAKPNLEMAALGGSKRASFAAPAISRIPWLSRSQGNTNVALPTELLRWGPGLRGVRIADRVAATSVPAGDHGATELRCRRIRRVFDFAGEAR